MEKVIIHISEKEKWSTTLRNIGNLNNEQIDFEIEVVVNDSAIKGYLEPEVTKIIETYLCSTILFVACDNSMKSHNMKKRTIKFKHKNCFFWYFRNYRTTTCRSSLC